MTELDKTIQEQTKFVKLERDYKELESINEQLCDHIEWVHKIWGLNLPKDIWDTIIKVVGDSKEQTIRDYIKTFKK